MEGMCGIALRQLCALHQMQHVQFDSMDRQRTDGAGAFDHHRHILSRERVDEMDTDLQRRL